MSEIDPHDLGEPAHKPYAYLTEKELWGLYYGFMAQHEACHWWEWIAKTKLLGAAGATYNMIGWIQGGKQSEELS